MPLVTNYKSIIKCVCYNCGVEVDKRAMYCPDCVMKICKGELSTDKTNYKTEMKKQRWDSKKNNRDRMLLSKVHKLVKTGKLQIDLKEVE